MNTIVCTTNHRLNKLQTPNSSKNHSQLTKEVHGQTIERNEHHNAHDQSLTHQIPKSLENNRHSQKKCVDSLYNVLNIIVCIIINLKPNSIFQIFNSIEFK